MNPFEALEEVATAIKHRTVSTTHRWYIVYYYDRITCVPSYKEVPVEIIIGYFTETMVQRGFTVHEWFDIRTNITKLYKELHK